MLKETLFILYADNANVFITGKDEYKLGSPMNSALNGIDVCLKGDKLSLSVEKSAYDLQV